jgi:hypothetical protein
MEMWHRSLNYVFFSTKLKSYSSLESKVQKDLEREIDSR